MSEQETLFEMNESNDSIERFNKIMVKYSETSMKLQAKEGDEASAKIIYKIQLEYYDSNSNTSSQDMDSFSKAAEYTINEIENKYLK